MKSEKRMIQKESIARIDMRLSESQKLKFEKARRIAGFKTLSEFIVTTVNDKSNKIIEKDERIIVSKRDRDMFFDAITNPPEPTMELINLNKEYVKNINNIKNGIPTFKKRTQKK